MVAPNSLFMFIACGLQDPARYPPKTILLKRQLNDSFARSIVTRTTLDDSKIRHGAHSKRTSLIFCPRRHFYAQQIAFLGALDQSFSYQAAGDRLAVFHIIKV